MIDVQELLRTKENQIARVREEIKALHIVASLLTEPQEPQASQTNAGSGATMRSRESNLAEEDRAEDDPAPDSGLMSLHRIPAKRSRLRTWLGFAAGQ
jgi:hypothetical protein